MIPQIYSSLEGLISEFSEVRKTTMEIFSPLSVEDAVMQSDTFGSPPNWHIAHVTWFFQKVLEKHGRILEESNPQPYLNSYYQQYGNILPKQERGRFPRPTVKQAIAYRSQIEKEVISFLQECESREKNLMAEKDVMYDITLGMQHEMQHQELMVYDFQHYFQRFRDPKDNYIPATVQDPPQRPKEKPIGMVEIPGGIYELGFSGKGFCYDNELPEHKVYLQTYRMDLTPVTNGDFIKFVKAGGYEDYKYWLADGWDLVQAQGWKAPLYWENNKDGRWVKKDFRGLHEIEPDEPVVNVSYYEADAYARWAGKRLPTEAEWEKAASWNENLQRKTMYPWGDAEPTPRHANLMESWIWSPTKIGSYPEGRSYYGCHQMVGDVWEWTSSEYVLYPGFMSKFQEYTDKWAINQKVLRGGCFATPSKQIRNSYRNYFKPHERILFSGFRCAQDITPDERSRGGATQTRHR
jgi:ergothioneine biosynthesis protein EgtB